MTECSGCGGCCDPVVLPFTKLDAMRGHLRLDEATRRWILEDLRPIGAREGLRRAPHLKSAVTMGAAPDGFALLFSAFYECRHYDPKTRRCDDYDNRPPPCRGFPWFGGPPEPARPLPLACEFRRDIGQEPVPVELVAKAQR